MIIKFSIKNLLHILLILTLGYIFYMSKEIIFVSGGAALIAYMVDPLVEKIYAHKIPRVLSAIIVFSGLSFIIIAVLFWLAPEIYKDLELLKNNTPSYVKQGVDLLEKLGNFIGIDLSANAIYQRAIDWIQNSGSTILNWAGGLLGSVTRVFSVTFNFVLVPVLVFMIMLDYHNAVSFINRYVGVNTEVRKYFTLFGLVMASYFRGQIIVALILAVLYSLILKIVGLDAAILLGCMTGLLSIVPFLGFTVGIVVSLISAAIQFQDFLHPLYVVLGYAAIQWLESFYITPKIVGKSVGMHPVFTIVILLIGGGAFGIAGMILALPVTSFAFHIYKAKYSMFVNPDIDFADERAVKKTSKGRESVDSFSANFYPNKPSEILNAEEKEYLKNIMDDDHEK